MMTRKRSAPATVAATKGTVCKGAVRKSHATGDPPSKKVKLSHDQEALSSADAVRTQISSDSGIESVTADGDLETDDFENGSDGQDPDNDDSGEYDDLQDGIDESDDNDDDQVWPSKRRKRSLSPPLLTPSGNCDWSSEVSERDDMEQDVQATEQTNAKSITLQLTINIPPGHRGPITLEIKPDYGTCSEIQASSVSIEHAKASVNRKGVVLDGAARPRQGAGFLDLAAELRNQIYRHVFVNPDPLNFANPTNFSRSAALLRTCHQVHNEGRSILYSENSFTFKRRSTRYGSLWKAEWNELGFKPVQCFIKSIGAINTGLIRSVRLHLQDAVPCLNPSYQSHDVRRFINDGSLTSVLRYLGKHARLQRLELLFQGRRRVQLADESFLVALRRVKADEVIFVNHDWEKRTWNESKQAPSVAKMLLATCTRVHKLFPDDAPKKPGED